MEKGGGGGVLPHPPLMIFNLFPYSDALVAQYSFRTAAEQSDAVFFLQANCISADPIMRPALLFIKHQVDVWITEGTLAEK